MDIQEDNGPWGNIVGARGDAPTCLDRLDYLAEGEVVGDAEDDNRNSLDRKGSSYNAEKDMAGTQAEDLREESREALGLQRVSKTVPNTELRLTLRQELLGVMLSGSGLLLVFLFLLFVSVGSLSLPRFLGRCGCRLGCWLRRSWRQRLRRHWRLGEVGRRGWFAGRSSHFSFLEFAGLYLSLTKNAYPINTTCLVPQSRMQRLTFPLQCI